MRIVSDKDIIAFVTENPSYRTRPLSVASKLDVNYKKVVRVLRQAKLLDAETDGYEIHRTFGLEDYT